MDTEKALDFLKQYQPMPDDLELTETQIDIYDNVRKFFVDNPDERCIPLFLNSFGRWGGYGVYQLVDEVFWHFDKEIVVPYLVNSLQSEHEGVCYWNAQIACDFPDKRLTKPLERLLLSPVKDIQKAAQNALEFIERGV